MQDQTDQVQQALQEEDLEAQRVEFLLEAQRISCSRAYHFPRDVNQSGSALLDSGAETPSDLYAGTVSEEEVSAALGCSGTFGGHAMSKYLATVAIVCTATLLDPPFKTIERQHRFRGGRWNEDNWNHSSDCWIEMWNAFVGEFVYRKGSCWPK
jgi:hypothetical protein